MFLKRKKMVDEKRQWERFDFFQATFCKYINEQKKEILADCFLKNISKGGLSFYLKDNILKVNSQVWILYKIGTKTRNDLLSIKNDSKFLGDWRYGGEFEAPDNERNLLIENHVSANSNKT